MTTPDPPQQSGADYLNGFVLRLQRELQDELRRVSGVSFPAIPEPEPAQRQRHTLEWIPVIETPTGEYLTIDEARVEMHDKIVEYISQRGPGRILLVKAKPGLGKTFTTTYIAQEVINGRVLYLMPTHAHYDTLTDMPHFNPTLWYHWQATAAPVPFGAEGETMCREIDTTQKLMQKGWPLSLACNGLCPLYQKQCNYRRQEHAPEPVIAAAHEHLALGMAINDYHTVIVDEEPIRAFMNETKIKATDIGLSEFAGPISELLSILRDMALSGGSWSGKRLLDQIGDLLRDVWALVDDVSRLMPAMPQISARSDADNLPAWFLPDLLVLLVGEWEAWRQGQQDWLARVEIENGLLILHNRREAWKKLPPRLVIIDATANVDLYRQMFPEREIEVYEPNVQMTGEVHQITCNYNGAGTFKDEAKLAELVELTRVLVRGYELPGIVTYKSATEAFQLAFPHALVAHFGGQRGSNALESCDVLVVVGTYSPPDGEIMRIAKTLNRERLRPFSVEETDKGLIPIRTEKLCAYNIRDEHGRVAHRVVSGLWNDPDLHAVMNAKRGAEMVQAVHRARPLTRDVKVWLLSSVPTDIPLTAIYDDPPIAPEGIYWRTWLKIYERVETAESITIQELADWAGVGYTYVSGNKWLDGIMQFYKDEWEPVRISRKKGLKRL
ncbi:MAG: hypothetical protein KDD89_07055 [Anaerolineales bacterium]|nr:hypothetical protein [Anaerolineales bacterium]